MVLIRNGSIEQGNKATNKTLNESTFELHSSHLDIMFSLPKHYAVVLVVAVVVFIIGAAMDGAASLCNRILSKAQILLVLYKIYYTSIYIFYILFKSRQVQKFKNYKYQTSTSKIIKYSQENNNILGSLCQSHLFAKVTPRQLGTFQP